MREIGDVASPTKDIEAHVILRKGEEIGVEVEDVMLIDNLGGNRILAVCRRGFGMNPSLEVKGYGPGIGLVRIGKKVSRAKESHIFKLSIMGSVNHGRLERNRRIIVPGSSVSVYEESDNPLSVFGDSKYTLGYRKYPRWRVPVDKNFIQYHIGIFASTGHGKTLLTRHELIPLLVKAGYKPIIFDWKGIDYAPFFSNVVSEPIYPTKIIEMLRDKRTVVVDAKRQLDSFLQIGSYLKERMQAIHGLPIGERLKPSNNLYVALIIEEAPEYCPWKGKGKQSETTDLIKELCALGRTYYLSVILISQGIAGEIGVNAAIRRNLNTYIIGGISAPDIQEVSDILQSKFSGIDPQTLAGGTKKGFPPGHFYLAGAMNCSSTPIEIAFDLPED